MAYSERLSAGLVSHILSLPIEFYRIMLVCGLAVAMSHNLGPF